MENFDTTLSLVMGYICRERSRLVKPNPKHVNMYPPIIYNWPEIRFHPKDFPEIIEDIRKGLKLEASSFLVNTNNPIFFTLLMTSVALQDINYKQVKLYWFDKEGNCIPGFLNEFGQFLDLPCDLLEYELEVEGAYLSAVEELRFAIETE